MAEAKSEIVLIQLRRGLKKDLAELSLYEPGYAEDTKELYIGTPEGNVLIASATGVGVGWGSGDSTTVQSNAPDGATGKLWVNPDTDVLHYWNGSEWRPVVGVWAEDSETE